eukprot:TRINITY_DN28804_c0_g1_i1.p1 TRINITY_DN28804_c0_g1~~TRINITY_DN28804_c0_g1_i1.p1  ORF type:complete len:292 (+),score=82.15 TRINITY_DN28804_c0_g1_i1:46-876(+)
MVAVQLPAAAASRVLLRGSGWDRGSYRVAAMRWPGEAAAPALPVMLLHEALRAAAGQWSSHAVALQRKGICVHAYDRLGFGGSDPASLPEWPLDYLSRSAAELLDLLDAIGWRRGHLVGHSDGAAIAMLAAARRPEAVASVVAAAPHMWYDSSTVPGGVKQVAAVAAAAGGSLRRALTRDHGSAEHGDLVFRRWQQRWSDLRFHSWNEGGALRDVRCPVLLLHGAADPFWRAEHAEAIAQRLGGGATLRVVDAGHNVPREMPDFDEQVVAFTQQSA